MQVFLMSHDCSDEMAASLVHGPSCMRNELADLPLQRYDENLSDREGGLAVIAALADLISVEIAAIEAGHRQKLHPLVSEPFQDRAL